MKMYEEYDDLDNLKYKRASRRKAALEAKNPSFSNKVHKSKKDYNRKEMKRNFRNLEW